MMKTVTDIVTTAILCGGAQDREDTIQGIMGMAADTADRICPKVTHAPCAVKIQVYPKGTPECMRLAL